MPTLIKDLCNHRGIYVVVSFYLFYLSVIYFSSCGRPYIFYIARSKFNLIRSVIRYVGIYFPPGIHAGLKTSEHRTQEY